jgi:biotin transporter BioY
MSVFGYILYFIGIVSTLLVVGYAMEARINSHERLWIYNKWLFGSMVILVMVNIMLSIAMMYQIERNKEVPRSINQPIREQIEKLQKQPT